MGHVGFGHLRQMRMREISSGLHGSFCEILRYVGCGKGFVLLLFVVRI